MKPPHDIKNAARHAQIEIRGWDEVRGELRASDGEFLFSGSHDEIREFLQVDDLAAHQKRERLESAAAARGFLLDVYDDTSANISGHGVAFNGSHDSVRGFLSGWDRRTDTLPKTKLPHAIPEGCEIALMVIRSLAPVYPGECVQITVRPQATAFRGSRIAIPDRIAPYFHIRDLKVGNCSQLGPEGVPATMFAMRIDRGAKFKAEERNNVVTVSMTDEACASFGNPIRMKTCQTAMDISMIVQLKPEYAYLESGLEFEAIILGLQVKPGRSPSRQWFDTLRYGPTGLGE